ncbi:MAG: sulfotransferase domain-containing protein, partial [Anaerolineales bacterium]|nr:sulfotransferase domain-containing protein [Anaerolineales bacterium]
HKRAAQVNANKADVYLLSFPKCGRTWLRLLLAKTLSLHFRLNENNLIDLSHLATACPEIPIIKVTHDDNPMWKTPRELLSFKSEYQAKKVILLVRDPRDVVVSLFFQYTKRIKRKYQHDIDSFIRKERGSLKTIIAYYNIWAEKRHLPADFLLVRYEDLHTAPAAEIQRVLNFLEISQVSPAVIESAISFASLKNMRRMEREQVFEGIAAMKLHDKDDPEAYKARKGKVGGFTDYLDDEQIQYVNRQLAKLTDNFGYTP